MFYECLLPGLLYSLCLSGADLRVGARLLHSQFQLRILPVDFGAFFLQLLNPLLQFLNLVVGARAELLNDLEDTPQTAHHDQRADLFDYAVEEDIDNEARDDDYGVKDVEL